MCICWSKEWTVEEDKKSDGIDCLVNVNVNDFVYAVPIYYLVGGRMPYLDGTVSVSFLGSLQ